MAVLRRDTQTLTIATNPHHRDEQLESDMLRPLAQPFRRFRDHPGGAEERVTGYTRTAAHQAERRQPVERAAGVLCISTGTPCTNVPSTTPWAKVANSEPKKNE